MSFPPKNNKQKPQSSSSFADAFRNSFGDNSDVITEEPPQKQSVQKPSDFASAFQDSFKKKVGGEESASEVPSISNNQQPPQEQTLSFTNLPTNEMPSVTTNDGYKFDFKNPTPLGNNTQDLQQRINSKQVTPQDIQTIADATGKSADVVKSYILGGNRLGAATENNEQVANTQNKLRDYITTYNKIHATDYVPNDVMSSAQKLSDFLQTARTTVENPQQPRSSQYAVSDVTRLPVRTFYNVIPDEISDEMLNQVVRKTVQEDADNGVPHDVTLDKIVQRINPRDYARIKDVPTQNKFQTEIQKQLGTAPTGILKDLSDKATEQNQLLNYQRGIADLKYNQALQQNALDKVSQGITSGNQELIQSGQNDLNLVDNNVINKYPALVKQQIAQQVNDYIAKESGVVKGYDAESLRGYSEKISGASSIDRLNAMKALGFLDNPNTKDIALSMVNDSSYFADNSILGGVVPSFLQPFKDLGMSIGDMTGLRTKSDILSDNLKDQIFEKDFSAHDENNPDQLQLKNAVRISRNILNTSANLAGMTAIAASTEGLGEAAGLSTKAAQSLGAYTSFGLPSFDASLKDAKNFIGSEPAQYLYAAINSIANAEGGRILDLGKIVRIPEVSEDFSKIAKGLSDESLTEDGMNKILDGVKNKYIDFATKYGKNVSKGAATMAYFNIANNITKMAFGDQQAQQNFLPQAGHAFLDGVLGMSIIGLFGAAADMRNEKNTSFKGTIYNMALNHDAAKDVFTMGLKNGDYTKPEYDQKVQILNTAVAAKNALDATEKETGIELTPDQKAVYVANKTAQAVFEKKANQEGIPEDTKNKYLEQANRLAIQSTQVLDGLKFTPTLVPLYDLYNAEKEYNQALENYSPDNAESENALEAAKNNYDKLYSDYLKNQSEKPIKQKITTIPEGVLNETQDILGKINNAENININDLSKAEDNLYEVLDKHPEASHLIEPLILQIQNYPDEFKTKTEVSTVTEKVPTGRTAKIKTEIKPALEQSTGSKVTVTSPSGAKSEGILRVENGNYVVFNENGDKVAALGEKVINDRDLKLPSQEEMDNPIQFDKNGNVKSVTVKTRTGNFVSIENPEKALDIAIQLQAQAIGEVPDGAFNEIYEDVQKEVSKEVPIISSTKTTENDQVKNKKEQGVQEKTSQQEPNVQKNAEANTAAVEGIAGNAGNAGDATGAANATNAAGNVTQTGAAQQTAPLTEEQQKDYDNKLNNITQSNENTQDFEHFLNNDEAAKAELQDEGLPSSSEAKTVKTNEPLSQQERKDLISKLTPEQRKDYIKAHINGKGDEYLQGGKLTAADKSSTQPQDAINENKNVTSQKISQDANDIITGKKVFERFSPQEQRGFAEGGTNHVEASLLLAAGEGAGGKDNTTPEAQEGRIEQYAKDKGIWTDNTTQELTKKYGEPIARGEEAIVWHDPKTGNVIKSQDTFQYDNLQQKLDGITLHNSYFPEAPIKVLGYGRNSKGEFQVIVEQPHIQGEKLTPDEIHNYIEGIGFKKDENGNYNNGDTIIEDVHTGNAIKDKDGNIIVIDPIMRLNAPEQGYGGERKISNSIISNKEVNAGKGKASSVSSEGDKRSDADIENRMTELSKLHDDASNKEFDLLEKEMAKRERATVFNVPISEAKNAIDALMKKEKEMPNGWGSFITKRDASESKSVIDDYSNPKDISDDQLKRDFKNALMGRPATWYADGLKLRESMKEAANRGIDINDMLKEIAKEFTKDGYDINTAKEMIAYYLKPVFEGSQKVETNKNRVIEPSINAAKGEASSVSSAGGKISDADISNEKLKDEKNIGDYVQKAKSVLNTLYPDAKLEVYDNSKDYVKAGGESGTRGFSILDKNGQHRVLLNLEQIKEDKSGKTAFHEVIHPIVYDAFGVDKSKLVPIWNDIAKELTGVKGFDKVWNHVVLYDRSKIAPEGITEFLTQVAAGNIDLKDIPKSNTNKVIDLINRLFDALGIKYKLNGVDDLYSIASKIKDAFDTGNAEDLKDIIKGGNIDKYIADYEKQLADKEISKQEYDKKISELKDLGFTQEEIYDALGKKGEGGRIVGVAHSALSDLAKRLNLPEPVRGKTIPVSDLADRGKRLLSAGVNPDEIKNTNNDLHDRISIARAHLEKLVNDADNIAKNNPDGINSLEYKAALDKVNNYSKDVVKSLGTQAHLAFKALQKARDLDTGSFTSIRNATEQLTKKPTTEEQNKKINDLTEENNKLKKESDESEVRLKEATDKAFQEGIKEGKRLSKTERAHNVANKLRQAAKIHKPDSFSAATPASLAWDTAVEIVAKSIEAGGKIADAIDAGLEHIRNTDWYKSLNDDKKQKAENDFTEFSHDNTNSIDLEDLQARFLDKKGNKFTHNEAKSIWEYAKKEYLEKGDSWVDMISGVKEDLGLTWRQVNEALTTPKTKPISDEMWKKKADYARHQNVIRNWVDNQNASPASKFLKKVSGIFRGVSVFGHGGIFVGTHAGMTLFQPSTWKYTIPAFFRGWKYAYGNEANYLRSMQELKDSPNYIIAQRAGLNNNPDRINVEEFQKSQKWLGKLGKAGEKGFNAIKVLRQNLFDYHYNKLTSEEQKDSDAVERIAKLVNNATGASNLKIPEWVNEVTFAGGMESARWGKLIRNPIKATEVALRALLPSTRKNVSTADKVFAKVWANRVGQQIGTYGALLGANAIIQNLIHPNNPVNFTNPNAGDWLKFKFGDEAIDPTSGMRGVMGFVYHLGQIPFENQKQLHGDTRTQAAGKQVFGYGRGKLAPLYSTLADLYTSQDFNKNPLPYSPDKPGYGKHRLTWAEYAESKLPIPVAEAFNVMHQSAINNGTTDTQWNDILKGIFSGAISGTTGFRASEYNSEEHNHSPFTEEDKNNPVFKYYIDKGLNLPNTSLRSERITNHKTGSSQTIADFPKEIQKKYQDIHKRNLQEELSRVQNKTLYIQTFRDGEGNDINRVSENEPKNGKYKRVLLNSLDKNELEQVLHIAQIKATKKSKEEFIKTYNK